jgi:hypothetical protein
VFVKRHVYLYWVKDGKVNAAKDFYGFQNGVGGEVNVCSRLCLIRLLRIVWLQITDFHKPFLMYVMECCVDQMVCRGGGSDSPDVNNDECVSEGD